MPHSSGGGSHGGGSYSGGSHYSGGRSSSGSSGGSYSSSGGSSYSEKPISRRPYPGATRYVYYDSFGHVHNIYHQGRAERADLETSIGVIIVISLIFVPIIWLISEAAVFIPHQIHTASYNSEIVIDDHVGFVDTVSMSDALLLFQDKTGVTPAVEIVTDSEWEPDYTDLETFAYSEYLRMFDDEKHWLFVISYPDDYQEKEFIDWSWHGMIGDDVGSAINYTSEDNFTNIMHKHMLRSSPDKLDEQLSAAFNEFSAIVMDNQISTGFVVTDIILFGIYLAILYYFIHDYMQHRQLEKAVRVKNNAKQYACEYCGCMYVSGTVSVCPHCGAAIPPHN